MSLSVTYHPTSGWTTPVFPVYNDQTHLITSSSSGRRGYRALVDVNINDNKVATLACYPFKGIIQANPALSQNYIAHNFNYDVVRCVNNPDSVKKINLSVGESYSRTLNYTGITSGSGWFYTTVILKFDTSHNLYFNDRVYVVQDNPSINPQYNNYWSVIGINGNNVEIDCPYVYTPANEKGIAYEGVEMYDFAYNSDGEMEIITVNNHDFQSGDTITIAMDSYATAKVRLMDMGTINQITINGVGLLSSPFPFNTSISQTLSNIAAEINFNTTNPNYSAYHYPGSDILHIYSTRLNGTVSNGYPVSISSSGFTVVYSPAMFINRRQDVATSQGWNPQFSNTYVIDKITAPNKFTLTTPLPNFLNNEPGSQRGSIVGNNPYIFSATVTGNTYYIQNASNFYEYNNYSQKIAEHRSFSSTSKFLTTRPRNNFEFYSNFDLGSYDMLQNASGNTGSSITSRWFVVQAYTGTTHNPVALYPYLVSMSDIVVPLSVDSRWRRISYGFGAWNLNKINPSFITPTPPIGGMINNDVVKYEVYLIDEPFGAGGVLSETLTFNRRCSPHKYHQLIFLNKFGAYDYFPVTGNFQNKLAIERSSFDKKRNKVESPYNYSSQVDYRGSTTFNINSTQKIKLYSNWLTLNESEWLQQVFESPEVYLYLPNESNASTIDLNVLFPITITDSEVTLPNDRSKMKRFEFNADISYKRINQGN